jgi:hypothetical protein
MSNPIVVHLGRTTKVTVSLGFDVSADTLTSEIRENKSSSSTKLAEWDVSFLTDGTDGELVLTLDDSGLAAVDRMRGWMDIKRVSGGEPLPVFSEPLPVVFRRTVTA